MVHGDRRLELPLSGRSSGGRGERGRASAYPHGRGGDEVYKGRPLCLSRGPDAPATPPEMPIFRKNARCVMVPRGPDNPSLRSPLPCPYPPYASIDGGGAAQLALTFSHGMFGGIDVEHSSLRRQAARFSALGRYQAGGGLELHMVSTRTRGRDTKPHRRGRDCAERSHPPWTIGGARASCQRARKPWT